MTLTYYLVNKQMQLNVCIRSKDLYDNNNVLHKVNLSLGPSLTPYHPLFHPQFECSHKMSEIGYFVKLGILFHETGNQFSILF
jgi:hypothetical protein